MTSADAPRFGVVGDPIAHSLSPVLHRAGYDALGIDARYDAVQVPAGGLAAHVAALGPEWGGLSVTAPLKREALALATTVTARATLAGGANTLVRTADGWAADNTDLPGAVAAIRERYDGPASVATIVGAGATAASTGLALADLGVRTIRLLARDPSRAEETAAALAADPRLAIDVLPLDGAGIVGEIVVSTIPVAAQDDALVAATCGAAVVFEVVYDPWPSPLAAAAVERGQALVSGLDLLVHQAVLQFAMFTGHNGPLDSMRAAGEQALASR
ncbi:MULTISPECIES: shikimate dehydrogenase [unclassified Nocardioides]|jgi:shikimate dehydrogenase|uniref:shikimate dehydrogenase n=1 Tax=unclassified Nocardioides TaxID=2615069 RepID=UPI000702C757|nr:MULTISPECIES: shikimate dehydrogenase [unclassified Nocardioides]KRC49019.1 shikimate dehydrogenase [Nocardioides sp. Root79]KRC75420.1 shikimate dehydrogenase [Nocardioides sp. Root240]